MQMQKPAFKAGFLLVTYSHECFYKPTKPTASYTLFNVASARSLAFSAPKRKILSSRARSPRNSWYFACRSEEHTSELQSRPHLVCRLLLAKKKSQRTCCGRRL